MGAKKQIPADFKPLVMVAYKVEEYLHRVWSYYTADILRVGVKAGIMSTLLLSKKVSLRAILLLFMYSSIMVFCLFVFVC